MFLPGAVLGMLRGMSMSDHIGHDAVRRALVAANASGKVHHAYLFAGPRGVGKHHMARSFIAMVNCVGEAPTDAEGRRLDGCGSCRSCRRLLLREGERSGGHVDKELAHVGQRCRLGKRRFQTQTIRFE